MSGIPGISGVCRCGDRCCVGNSQWASLSLSLSLSLSTLHLQSRLGKTETKDERQTGSRITGFFSSQFTEFGLFLYVSLGSSAIANEKVDVSFLSLSLSLLLRGAASFPRRWLVGRSRQTRFFFSSLSLSLSLSLSFSFFFGSFLLLLLLLLRPYLVFLFWLPSLRTTPKSRWLEILGESR